MKNWHQALTASTLPGAIAGIGTLATVAYRGHRDTGSALAPINASSHALWGPRAGQVERPTLRHTLPGLAINLGAGLWWTLVFQKLFGAATERRGWPAAIGGGLATAALAYLLDYRILPRRLSPGWEQRITGRSLRLSLGVMGLGIGLASLAAARRR